MPDKREGVIILSGGMDSTTLLYEHLPSWDFYALGFDYGQRHVKELNFMAETCTKLDVPFHIVDLSSVGLLFDTSCLTNPDEPVPEGHYAAENMRKTVVPNRNAIMLSIAWGLAVDRKAHAVFTAVHAGDHFIYPDCRPAFIIALNEAFTLGNLGFGRPSLYLYTPYINLTKAQIAERGAKINVPWTETWSCYKGDKLHCGKCGTCVERKEAFQLAGVTDPTEYENA